MAHLLSNVRVLQQLKGHTNDVTCLEFWGTSVLATGSSDKTVRMWRWEIGSGFVEEPFSPLLGHTYGITCVRISPQGAVLASGSIDGKIILWDVVKGVKLHSLHQSNGESVRNCAFSANGAFIVSSDDSGAICVWNQQRTLLRVLRCHEESVQSLSFSADSNLLMSGCLLGNLRLLRLDNEVFANSNSQNIKADCMIDGAHDLGVLSTDFCRLNHNDPKDSDTNIYTAVSCGTDQMIRVWRIFSRAKRTKTHTGDVKSRFLPQSSQEHISGAATIYATSLINAECVLSVEAHGSSVTCVRFNVAGCLLVSTSLDKSVKVWDLQGKCLRTFVEHVRYVNCATFNENSKILASGSNDRSIIIWDLMGNITMETHLTEVRSILFSLVSSKNDVPIEFICPITFEIMRDPVITEDGFTYERSAIVEWFANKNASPMTNVQVVNVGVLENTLIKSKIEQYLSTIGGD